MSKVKLSISEKGEVLNATKSSYRPKKPEREATALFSRDEEQGYTIMNKGYTEFNHRNVVEEVNVNQKSFNSYVPPKSEDPDESWRAQTIRPVVRNKLVSIAAHVLVSILYPGIFAQNKNDDEDREGAEVMRMAIEWIIENYNYKRSFVVGIISALVNPAVILNQEFSEVRRTVKEMQDDGTYTKKEILDEVLSGFFTNMVPITELYIANIYEPEIQKQRFLIRTKVVDYEEAKIVHGHKPNFKYVKKGVMTVFNEIDGLFYDLKDDDLQENMVREYTYYNRYLDLELTFIGNVLLCDPEYPMQRADKLYPFAKSGFEPLDDGKFFYYKSAANKLGPDEDLVNTLYNMIMDGTFLALMPPMALYGNEEVSSSVMVPGTVTTLGKDTKLESIAPKSDLRAGLEAIGLVERSITESSQDNQRAGISSDKEQTASEFLTTERNAQIALGLFGKFIGFLVEDIGKLMMGDVLQHLSMPDLDKITSADSVLKYRGLLLPGQNVEGKKLTNKVKFTEDLFGKENLSADEYLSESYKVMNEEGGVNAETRIFKVNPDIFRELKFRVTVSPENLTPKNRSLERALNLELYDRAIQNPLSDQEAILRDFLFESYKPGESDKYISKDPPMEQMFGMDMMGEAKKKNSNFTGQITGSNSLKNAIAQG